MDYFKTDKWYPAGYVPTHLQRYAWETVKGGFLNPIRVYLDMPIIITNAIRIASDYQRLLSLGYSPSPTSDHYAGQRIKLPNGQYFSESTFAVDFVFDGDIRRLCSDVYRTAEMKQNIIANLDGSLIGQLIIEEQTINGKRTVWAHFGLSPYALYAHDFARALSRLRQKDKYLEFTNGTIKKTNFQGV